jgi:hypothetical protein
MDDDFLNQLTLNCLISKNQLHKLNKKLQEDTEKTRMNEIKQWEDRIKKLFGDLLVNDYPSDILLDVKNSFDAFVDKSIYYFKNHDKMVELEKERNEDIKDDIDYEIDERNMEKGNYVENDDCIDLEDEEHFAGVVENINTNWFENVRKKSQKNKIIPRK